jgi:hypothetical protein
MRAALEAERQRLMEIQHPQLPLKMIWLQIFLHQKTANLQIGFV